jgi:hypothetical protein
MKCLAFASILFFSACSSASHYDPATERLVQQQKPINIDIPTVKQRLADIKKLGQEIRLELIRLQISAELNAEVRRINQQEYIDRLRAATKNAQKVLDKGNKK